MKKKCLIDNCKVPVVAQKVSVSLDGATLVTASAIQVKSVHYSKNVNKLNWRLFRRMWRLEIRRWRDYLYSVLPELSTTNMTSVPVGSLSGMDCIKRLDSPLPRAISLHALVVMAESARKITKSHVIKGFLVIWHAILPHEHQLNSLTSCCYTLYADTPGTSDDLRNVGSYCLFSITASVETKSVRNCLKGHPVPDKKDISSEPQWSIPRFFKNMLRSLFCPSWEAAGSVSCHSTYLTTISICYAT